MPHYGSALVLVIVFSGPARLAPRSAPAWRLGLGLGAFPLHDPAGDHHVGDPDGIVTRTVPRWSAIFLSQEFVTAAPPRASRKRVFVHVAKNAAPTAIAVRPAARVSARRLDLIETVFSCRAPASC